MNEDLEKLISHVLKRFIGMPVNKEVLSFMATEINDALNRVYPEQAESLYVQPIYNDGKITFDTYYKH